jgi:hypothetical protein
MSVKTYAGIIPTQVGAGLLRQSVFQDSLFAGLMIKVLHIFVVDSTGVDRQFQLKIYLFLDLVKIFPGRLYGEN